MSHTWTELDNGATLDPSDGPGGGALEGRYTLGRTLGEGGMGRVVEAVDAQFGRVVAVKLLSASSEPARARFSREARITARLQHAAIPPVYEQGRAPDGTAWYAMQRIDGATLAARMRQVRDATERMSLFDVIVQVAHALGHAHARGIVHRDVKPENIMVGDHGQVWLVDWGIAREPGASEDATGSDEPLEPGLTRVGAVVGTPAYMSPEQARGATDEVGPPSDVYALGATLYELLAGHPPHLGDTVTGQLRAARTGERAPLDPARAGVPSGLAGLVARAMAPTPQARFPDGSAMAAALIAYRAQAALTQEARRARRIGGVSLAVSAVTVSLALVSAWTAIPSAVALGGLALLYVLLALVGIGLSVADLRTGGRQGLSWLALGTAVATVLLGGSVFVTGMLHALDLAAAPPEALGPSSAQELLIQGAREASGNLSVAALLGNAQILAWAFARWRADSEG